MLAVLLPGSRTPTLRGQETTSADTLCRLATSRHGGCPELPRSGSCCPWSAWAREDAAACLQGRGRENTPADGLRGVGGVGAVPAWAPTVPLPGRRRAPTATRGTRGPSAGFQVSGDRIRELPAGRRETGAGVLRSSGRDAGRPEPGEQSSCPVCAARLGPLTSLGGSRGTPHRHREKESLRCPELYLREA